MDKSLYRRPAHKPRRMVVTSRRDGQSVEPLTVPAVLEVSRYSECHVTPPAVAGRMVSYLSPADDLPTLEPQAGTGNLIQALCDAGHARLSLVAVERDFHLFESLRTRFTGNPCIEPIHRCFLDYAESCSGSVQFSRILMNPPFKRVRRHMAAALSLLGHGGSRVTSVLVALVPVTYHHDEAEELERLSLDTFPTARVHTKIIRIVR